jgi:apolipoprotein N-acyltransferase
MIQIAKLAGWRRNVCAFLFGICATLTLAPFYFFPLIIPAYGGLFLLVISANSSKRAFADGWWWGWGFYISGLYWFCIALLTDAEKFAWAIPFALFGLNAVIALYPALACLLFHFLYLKIERPGSGKSLLPVISCLKFSLIWFFVEYARGHLFTGFPWNLAGYSFGFSDISLQMASVLGAYGLTFFAVLLGASFALIKSNRNFVLLVWAIFVITFIWGSLRLKNSGEGEATGAVLRLVQADILQPHKWDPKLQKKNLEDYIALTQSPGLEKITHVIWPETATPYALRSESPLAYHLGGSLPAGVVLITGALRYDGEGRDADFYNSVMAINHEGKIIGNYDKHALVPFGEFMPFRSLIPKSLNLPVGDKDFSTGPGAQTLNWHGLPPVSVLVCYEGIFPEYAVDPASRPGFLLNLTNDAWFGMSSGPHQHFQMARMRAVEQGLPLVRVANTGISAYIDEYGRIKQQLALGEKGVLDIVLKRSSLGGSFYVNNVAWLELATICIILFLSITWRKLIKN